MTHYHGDHCSGLLREGSAAYLGYRYDANLPRVPVTTVYDYNSFHAGERTSLGGAAMTVLNSAYENADAGENERSLSFRLEYDGFVLTFGADIYFDQQARILRDTPALVPAHVYKANHHAHGSIDVDYLVDRMQSLDVRWSWFNTWTREFIVSEDYTTNAQKQRVYASDFVITLDELPDLRLLAP